MTVYKSISCYFFLFLILFLLSPQSTLVFARGNDIVNKSDVMLEISHAESGAVSFV